MTFSERFGIVAPKIELKLEEMPTSLRNGLWDALRLTYLKDIGHSRTMMNEPKYSQNFAEISRLVQFGFLKRSLDDLPQDPWRALDDIKQYFYGAPYHGVYEFIEFMESISSDEHAVFRDLCNKVLSREKSQFRIAGGIFVRIASEHEFQEVSKSIENDMSLGVAEHIKTAAQLYSRYPEPDYRNSVKESISAVESAVRFATGKRTNGVAKPLKMIEDEFPLHPALRAGFEKIFAFTSDSDGVRHALMEQSNISQADAKFMLVACSAFANYLLTLKSEQYRRP